MDKNLGANTNSHNFLSDYTNLLFLSETFSFGWIQALNPFTADSIKALHFATFV